jgi:hypothetical protein
MNCSFKTSPINFTKSFWRHDGVVNTNVLCHLGGLNMKLIPNTVYSLFIHLHNGCQFFNDDKLSIIYMYIRKIVCLRRKRKCESKTECRQKNIYLNKGWVVHIVAMKACSSSGLLYPSWRVLNQNMRYMIKILQKIVFRW